MKQKRLTVQERAEIWMRYQGAALGSGEFIVQHIAQEYQVSRPTIYAVLEKGPLDDLMGRHKWLSPAEREEIRKRYRQACQQEGVFVISGIACEYEVSRNTIYAVLEADRNSDDLYIDSKRLRNGSGIRRGCRRNSGSC